MFRDEVIARPAAGSKHSGTRILNVINVALTEGEKTVRLAR